MGELESLKKDISFTAYEKFLSDFQADGGKDKLSSMCILFNIELNVMDINETLIDIFKRAKDKLSPLVDFNVPSKAIKENLDFEELKIETPEGETTNDVIQRLVFLLEIKPATDYQTQVSKLMARGDAYKRAIFKEGKMVSIAETDEEDKISQMLSTKSFEKLADGNEE